MRKKQCKRCGLIFETARQGKYLCDACALESRRAAVHQEKQCIDCGKSFIGFPASLRCETCRAERQRQSERAYRRSDKHRAIGSIDICVNCGNPYTVNGSRQKYCPDCSGKCVAATIRANGREYMAAYMLRPGMVERKDANRHNNKICIVCGSTINPGSPTNVCSPECGRIRQREQQHKTDSKRAQKRSEAKKTARAKLKAELMQIPGAYESYRAEINTKARAAYARRKSKQED